MMRETPAHRSSVKKGRNEALVGMFVILGLIFLTVIVFFVSGVYIFRSGYSLYITYDYVSILDKGAPVRMAGVRVGEVNGVELLDTGDSGMTEVRVKLFIEKGVIIRENYKFYIRGTHVLSEPHIEISPEPGGTYILEPDARIIGVSPIPLEDLIGKAHEIAAHIEDILSGLRDALGDEDGRVAFKEVVKNLARITKSLSIALDGSEEDLKDVIKDVRSSTESISVILDKIEAGEGTAGKLLMEDELYQEMREFVAEIKAHPWKLLKKGSGRSKFLGIF